MEKRGLGRGLSALIGDSLAGTAEGNVREVALQQITTNPNQPRQVFGEEALNELSHSIREHGILQPLLVRRRGVEDYELIAGERRLRAAKMAGLSHVPVLIKEYDEVQSLEVAIVENVQRADINAVEAAYAYRKLIDEFGFSQQEVAKRVGKSQPSISNTLRLLDLPETILEGLLAGEITEGHARPLLQVQQSNPQALTLFWQTLRQRKLSVREAEKMAREIRIQAENPPKVTLPFQGELRRDANLVAAEEALQTVLGTKVSIHRSGRGGKIEIEFYSDAELEGILERLMGRDAPE